MKILSKIISLILLLSFVSCSTVPSTGYPVQFVPIKLSYDNKKKIKLTTPWSNFKDLNKTETQTFHQTIATQTSAYWTGDGGSGKSITILPPKASGLAKDQSYLPDFVANELVSNFNTFSAMTLFDRVNNQKQYDELLSGYYADSDKASMDLGHIASTDYMLLGNITKTSTGYALQLTVNKNSDKTTAASYSGTVTIAELDNLIGVRRASLDLLQKLGVQLTAQAKTELTKAPTSDQLNALSTMAQGIVAQRQGTEVAALTYFFQAVAFDASLAEAVSRTNILSANISTGNIGANVRNDFAWSDSWEAKLKETETFMNDMLRNTNPQRSIWYSDNIQEVESSRDREKRTTEFRIDAVLHTQAAFPVSVQKTVQAVYDGLQTTKRAQAWKFDGWPRQGRTNINPFNKQWGGIISIAFEMLNEQNKVIGKQTVEMDSRYSFSGTRLDGPGIVFTTVRFTGVKANDITDFMSIRIATINGKKPEESGISRIEPISAGQMQSNKSYSIYNGAIRPVSNDRNLGAVTIPSELWGERVTAIANGAYENRGITSVNIPSSVTIIGASAFASNRLTSITIPEGVITIGDKAFADNHWTTKKNYYNGSSETIHHGLHSVTIPNSVTYIGQEAFACHCTFITSIHWLVTEVTIGANVNIGKNAFGHGFEQFYYNTGRMAGIYKYGYGSWERGDSRETVEQKIAKNKREDALYLYGGLALLIGVVVGFAFLINALFPPTASNSQFPVKCNI
jgi:hypothetical protein